MNEEKATVISQRKAAQAFFFLIVNNELAIGK